MATTAVEVRAKLAEVLWRASRLSEAKEVLEQALRLVRPLRQPLQIARLQVRLGRVEMENSYTSPSTSTRATESFGAALAAFDAAEKLLGDDPAELGQEECDLWLEIQVDGRANLYRWWNEADMAATVLAKARPIAEAMGVSPRRNAGFYVQLAGQLASTARWRIDNEILAYARAG